MRLYNYTETFLCRCDIPTGFLLPLCSFTRLRHPHVLSTDLPHPPDFSEQNPPSAPHLDIYGACAEAQGGCRATVLRRLSVLRKQKVVRRAVDACPLQSLVTMAAALPVCYHGAISRKECEDLLGKKNKDGAYLIRDSETIQGAMCLCVYKQKVVYTYRLLQTHTGHYTVTTAGGLEETFFKTLDDLIRHYKRRNQGLAMHLRHSVKRKTAMLIHPRRPPEQEPQSMEVSLPEADHDYENAPDSSEYVEVLPP
ncbi:SH2 domain-containing protein 1B [Chelmon rostratus]|uniref:SH2 domain-containing protein 1B n=1 Tax=Chelmon rostratus TaxID=109905 RepID=UPI001BEA7F92|nr:SH2 domain-containing protein 1B [Chelmon rostratus]